jgi:dTDP-D-glucose 4,6-dehydratase
MKAIFEFDMNDPDDAMAHLRCTKSLDMTLALWEILLNTKKGFQYRIEADKYETQFDLLDAIYEMLHEEMRERDIDVEKLIR